MAVCTYSDVFEFVGAPADVQTTQQTAITNLISRCTSEVENLIGRKVESTTITNVLFQHGLNCEIFGEKLFLRGIYRDLYSISSLSEAGTALTLVTDYGQSNGYYLDSTLGIITRHFMNWNTEPFAIKISGSTGLGGASVLGDIKQAVIEMVAAKSGLWKINVQTEGGTIQSIRTTPSKETMASLQKYILREF